MLNTEVALISELSDTELDTVAAGWGGYSFKQVAIGNGAFQFASNNQANAAFINVHSAQGGT